MIRKHTPEDLESLLEIWFDAQALAHPFLSTEFLEQVKVDMRHKYMPGSNTWVYLKEGEIKGFISMMENEIGGLFVAPDAHKQGIGRQLVEYIRPQFDALEVEVFEKNEIGKAFYYKHGFELMKSYFHEGSEHEVLRLKLPGAA